MNGNPADVPISLKKIPLGLDTELSFSELETVFKLLETQSGLLEDLKVVGVI